MSITHRLFPKTVYQEDNLLMDKLDYYKDFLISKLNEIGTSRNELLNVPSTHKMFDRFFEYPELEELVKTICHHAMRYTSELGYSAEDISDVQMINMWVNYSDKGSFIFPHVHRDSFISGAFYIDCTPEDTIMFFNNPYEVMGRRPSTFNELNYEYMTYTCNPGRLLLFNSNFLHGTSTQKSEKKLTVSFNIR